MVKEKQAVKPKPGHWYTAEGKARHTVPYADGRPGKTTTVLDARKLELYPSVTTIAGIIARHNLSIWSENMFIDMCGVHPQGELESPDEYRERIRPLVDEMKEEAPRLGDQIHAMLEDWGNMMGEPVPEGLEPMLNGTRDWYRIMHLHLPKECERRIVPHLCGYGGTVDVLTETLETRKPVIIDYKSTRLLDKDGKKRKPKPWESHLMQLSAYRYALGKEEAKYKNARCMILYIATDDPGEVDHYELTELEMESYYQQFLLLAKYFAMSKDLTHVTEKLK